MLFAISFLSHWHKIGQIGNTKLTSTWNRKIAHVMIGVIKLVIKYFLEKMLSSTNQRVGMIVNLRLSHQFKKLGISGFNMEQNLNDSTSEESHPFSTIKLNQLLMLFF